MTMQTLTIRRPDDWHVHLRDGAMLGVVAPYTARQFARAIVMPNLSPPVTSVAAASAYRERIIAAAGAGFTPLMTCYLDRHVGSRRDRARVRRRRVGRGQALPGQCDDQFGGGRDRRRQYPPRAGADAGDRHAAADPRRGDRSGCRRIRPRGGVHRSRAGRAGARLSGAKDRARAYHHRRGGGFRGRCARECRGDDHSAAFDPQPQRLFAGGLRPHAYCLPVVKREHHRLAIRRAATSGSPKYFLGTDSAPHGVAAKEQRAAAQASSTRRLRWKAMRRCSRRRMRSTGSRRFASEHGARFYGLPLNDEHDHARPRTDAKSLR